MLLSLVPGLGQIYAGSPVKGVALILGAAGCLAMQDQMPLVLPLALLLFSTWDARMTAAKRNFRLTRGRSGKDGAGDGDWMLILGTVGLGVFYSVIPQQAGMAIQPWAVWAAYCVILVLSTLLGGRGGKKNVKEA
jgi:hypothetical protein